MPHPKRQRVRVRTSLLCATVAIALSIVGAGCRHGNITPGKIRVGWQVPWATQGQIVQTLKHTNALELNNIQAEFKGFSYGGPLNEAALASEVDVIFTADQPATTLLAKGAKWTIVGRLMYNRAAIYVPIASPIKTVSDLKGKRVAMPFGAAAQRDALKAMRDAGLDPATDVHSINLDIYQQNALVHKDSGKTWGDIDALVGFDPTPAIFELEGLARMLHVGTVVSLVLVSDEYLTNHPQDTQRFLQAFTCAWLYYATHQKQANEWFQQESRLQFNPAVLDVAASVEPNIRATSVEQLRLVLNDDDLKMVQSAAKFIKENGMATNEVSISRYYNPSYMNAAWQYLIAEPALALQVHP